MLCRVSAQTDGSQQTGGATSSIPAGELDGCSSIMLKSLFVCGILGALLVPAQCDLISVCVEDDNELRVDCRVEPKLSKINSYEFSWSSGSKESLINTNVSGSSAEPQFTDKSHVEELDPHGYRMILKGFTDKHPHNTTYICKISGVVATIYMEREQLVPCSAISVFLMSSCSWMASLLLLIFITHS